MGSSWWEGECTTWRLLLGETQHHCELFEMSFRPSSAACFWLHARLANRHAKCSLLVSLTLALRWSLIHLTNTSFLPSSERVRAVAMSSRSALFFLVSELLNTLVPKAQFKNHSHSFSAFLAFSSASFFALALRQALSSLHSLTRASDVSIRDVVWIHWVLVDSLLFACCCNSAFWCCMSIQCASAASHWIVILYLSSIVDWRSFHNCWTSSSSSDLLWARVTGIWLKGGGEEAVHGVGMADGVGNCKFEVIERIHRDPTPLLDSNTANSSGGGAGEAGASSMFGSRGGIHSIAYEVSTWHCFFGLLLE